MRVLNINVAFHDPAAAVAVDGKVVAAAEEKRLSRRKHGKCPVPFPAWDLPELAARWRPAESGIGTGDLDAIAKVTNVAYHVTHAAGPGPDVPGCDRGARAGGPRQGAAQGQAAAAHVGLRPAVSCPILTGRWSGT